MGEAKDHAVLSPSSAKRWIACNPSARFEQEFESSTSVFAEEGTLAHSVAEVLIKGRLGVLKPQAVTDFIDLAKIHSLYTPEMLTHCEQYADYCMSKVTGESIVAVESRFDLTDYIPESFGTGDFSAYTPSEFLIEFADLKYGKGVPVKARDNEQLMIYGLGAYQWFLWVYGSDLKVKTIRLNIYQPRLGDPSEWEISLEDLLVWAEKTLRPAAVKAFAGEGEYVVGDHCKFCKARVRCEALANHNLDLFKHELAEREMLTDEDIVGILKKVPLLISWANDIAEYALAEAIKGKKWTGMKLVEGKSNRVYVNEFDTLDKLRKAGHKDADIFTQPELLGVTKLKTAIGAKAFKELVEPDLRKPPGKPTLVNEEDPRVEFDRASTVFRDAEIREALAKEETE